MAWDRELAPRSDLTFEIHERHMWPEGYAERLNDLGVPVVLAHDYKDIDLRLRFPLERAIETHGDFFDCSTAYMLSLAILQNAKWIGLFGVTATEGYGWQRPGLEYLIGFARGRGIEVLLHPKAGSLNKPAEPGRYGWGVYDGTRHMLAAGDEAKSGY